MNHYLYSYCLQKCHIFPLSLQNYKLFYYLGILFFANPEIVAKANIPNRAIPRNNPAPWLTPAPTATSIESLIEDLLIMQV